MCMAEVTRSQRSPGCGRASCRVSSALSRVERARSSSSDAAVGHALLGQEPRDHGGLGVGVAAPAPRDPAGEQDPGGRIAPRQLGDGGEALHGRAEARLPAGLR